MSWNRPQLEGARTVGVRRAAEWVRAGGFVSALAAGLFCVIAARATAQSVEGDMINREYPLKALFLYNFGTYVEWPASAFPSDEHPFVIGVLGSTALDKNLHEIAATKKIGGRKISVQRFASVEAIGPCQILFISRDVPAPQQAQIVNHFKDQQILIVGETKDFAARGGAINFIVEDNKIKFEINPTTAKEHQLKISSKLLALAKIVQK